MKHTSIRQKGQNGEREIAALLNPIIHEVKRAKGFPENLIRDAHVQVQRNQMQTANGGADLINTYNLAIEVKRQEQLNINKWWEQTCKSASSLSNKHIPILMYRQNNRKWNVVMYGLVAMSQSKVKYRVTIDMPSFLDWFKSYVYNAQYSYHDD